MQHLAAHGGRTRDREPVDSAGDGYIPFGADVFGDSDCAIIGYVGEVLRSCPHPDENEYGQREAETDFDASFVGFESSLCVYRNHNSIITNRSGL